MTDLDDEFERLLREREKTAHERHDTKRKIGGRSNSKPAKGSGVDVPDKVHAAGGTVRRAAVPAGPKKGPATAPEPEHVRGPAREKVAARVSRGSTEPEWGREPFVPLEIPASRYPKRFTPNELKRGDSVWYRGERFYIDYFPSTWAKGTFARIATICPRDGEDYNLFEHKVKESQATMFCVPVDSLDKAPINKTVLHKQPTKTAVERREERKKTGATDIGDEVAVMLRECSTLEQVYECTSMYVGLSVADLKSRYGHLNPGQQRMNLGNKMRFKLKNK